MNGMWKINRYAKSSFHCPNGKKNWIDKGNNGIAKLHNLLSKMELEVDSNRPYVDGDWTNKRWIKTTQPIEKTLA